MNPSASLSYTDGAFMCAIRRANHPPHKLLPPAVSARHLHTREPLGRHGHAEQCVTRAPALPEGLLEAPVAEGTDPEEQETFETGVGLVEPVEEDEAEIDFLGEPTTGNLHLVSRVTSEGLANVLGLRHFDEIIETPYKSLQHSQRELLRQMRVPPSYPKGLSHRAVYCSRTLNLRSIQAIGYDMDYTLIHYDVAAWEGKAYAYGLKYLQDVGCPVAGLTFDPDLVIRGLIVDKHLGNMLKVDRFGYVKRAMHGTRLLSWSELRETYGRELVSLRNEARYGFLNTLFSVSEAVLYLQMVDRMDAGAIPLGVVANTYEALWTLVSKALYRTHVEGKLKAEIIQDPAAYVELDPDMARTLLDQKQAGKTLLLITNSDYQYTSTMMSHAYDRYLQPHGLNWRDLFDMVIVQARKPDFFNYNMSLYEVVTEDGLMRPVMTAQKGGLFCGGSARMVEAALKMEGDDILYVGDHIYTDAALAKINFRWRTALIVRELEEEVEALASGKEHRLKLKELMNKKELVGDLFNNLRLARQRLVSRAPPPAHLPGHNGSPLDASVAAFPDEESINSTLAQLLMVMERLDARIGPMLEEDGKDFSRHWGYLSRAGLNDKSQFTRQIEKYADIYTSRVSNFLRYTPFAYFRSPSQSLAHDRNVNSRNAPSAESDIDSSGDSFDAGDRA